MSYEVTFAPIDWNGKDACLVTITDRTEAIEKQESLQKLIKNTPGCMVVAQLVDNQYVTRYISDGLYELLQIDKDINSNTTLGLDNLNISSVDKSKMIDLLRQSSQDKKPFSFDHQFFYGQNKNKWLNVLVRPVFEENGELYFYVLYTDITARKLLEEDLRMKEDELIKSFSMLGKHVMRFDMKKNRLYLTQNIAKKYGLPLVFRNLPNSILNLPILNNESKELFEKFYNLIISGAKTGVIDIPFLKKSGESLWNRIEFSTIFDDKHQPVRSILSVQDVTKELDHIKKIEHKAQNDGLTGIYNRATAEDLIKKSLLKDKNFAFAMIDMDGLKYINDTFGHAIGDKAIKKVANTIKNHFRSGDIVSRFGGDEFGVYLSEVKDIDTVVKTFEHLLELIQDEKIKDNFTLSCSAGLYFGNGKNDFKSAYIQADSALYDAKHSGKQTVKHRVQEEF